MPVIKIKILNKVFGDNEVLKDINLEINQGEVVAIIGPSGKSEKYIVKMYEFIRRTQLKVK